MYICKNCWSSSLKWSWKCMACNSWGSLEEKTETKGSSRDWKKVKLTRLTDQIKKENSKERIKTSSKEFNNVLWWWIVEWSLILLSWEPGIWKSTITLQIWSRTKDKNIVYVSWEENEAQILSRSQRLWVDSQNVELMTESNLENIMTTLEHTNSDLVIIDSISVLSSDNQSGSAWSINQVKYIAEILMNFAKSTWTAVIIIWHVTKDWNLAWPKTLEHLVDAVLYFEWDKYDDIRLLRWIKNRFGSTNEVWIFKMTEEGLKDVANPGLEFVENEKEATVWSSLSITLEWTRAIIIETESLTTYTKFWYPKRSSRWMISQKLDMIIAILSKYTKVKLESYDVYTNIARWLKIQEPWIDLAIAASIISSKINSPLPRDTIFIWELSLTWKIKNILEIEKRIKEAEKLWYKRIFIPDIPLKSNNKIEVIKLKNILDLIKYLN